MCAKAREAKPPKSQEFPLSEANYPQGACWPLFKILMKTKKLIIQYKNGSYVSWPTFN